MKNKPNKILLVEGFLTPYIYRALRQHGYSVSKVKTLFALMKMRKNSFRLIVGQFAQAKDNRALNRHCLKENIAWLPYRFIGKRNVFDVGPLVQNSESACFACYEKRLAENYVDTSHTDRKDSALLSTLHLVAVTDIFFGNKIKPRKHLNYLYSLQLPAGKSVRSLLLQSPLCPDCRTAAPDKKIRIRPLKVVYRENGLRTVASEKTWKTVQGFIHHAGPVAALVEHNKPIEGCFAYEAISADPIGNNRFRTHAGKGISLTQNRLSASLEAVERYCAKYAMLDPFASTVNSSFADLDKAVHPSRFELPIKEYADTKVMPWTAAWSLQRNGLYYVPREFVSLIPIGSNGLASGNTIEEAILHAIFELVERDIYMIMDFHELVMPDLDIKSVESKHIRDLLHQLDRSGMEYRIKYIKTDTGISTFGMYITGPSDGKTGYAHAVCSHLDRDIALSRTVTEAIQLFPKYLIYDRWLDKNTRHYTQPAPSLRMEEIPSYAGNNLKQNIDRCIKLLGNRGLETLVVNHTLPGFGFAVVRVLIPGLQPIWFRENNYLVSRVFTVPQTIGFKAKPKGKLNLGEFCGFPYKR